MLCATLFALPTLLPLSYTAHAQQTSISKQEFVDTQINATRQAQEAEQQREKRNIDMLKKALPAKDFEKMMADEAAAEEKEKTRMAKCLGISEADFKGHEESFNTEFQIELIQTCAAELPETISIKSNDWGNNPDLAGFQACAEAQIAKRTQIPAETLLACSESSEPQTE